MIWGEALEQGKQGCSSLPLKIFSNELSAAAYRIEQLRVILESHPSLFTVSIANLKIFSSKSVLFLGKIAPKMQIHV